MDSESCSSATTRSGSSGQLTDSTGTDNSRNSSRGRRIKRMIHALSFERPRCHKNKKKSSNKAPTIKSVLVPHESSFVVPTTSTPTTPVVSNGRRIPEAPSSETFSDASSILSQLVVRVNPKGATHVPGIVRGTLVERDSDDDSNDVEVIFYDTFQEGDGENEDEFDSNDRDARDCVILDNVIAMRAGGEYVDIEITPEMIQMGTVGMAPPPSPIPVLRRDPTWIEPPMAPPAPNELPLRFLRAGKGDPAEGIRRYKATLAWRRENGVDNILREPSIHFRVIKENYPHFCHGKGYHGEPCYYEQPPKVNLKAMRAGGASLEHLLRHYTMVTEFQWQYLVRDDLTRSIYIIDLEGMKFTDFAGEVVDFVKKASALSSQHYPERAGVVFVINVPGWFKMIWNVIKPWVDEVTLKKIFILRDKEEIRQKMEEKIPPENLPQEYGGKSPYPLGKSPEEVEFAALVAHNNRIAQGDFSCGGAAASSSCRFCTWTPPRSY